uniref:UPAR/Ly6 domain-containing protein n=1 Tax=Oreochromis aureus TaxID=47969 RepID=A0A668V352_OREAU
KSFQITFNARKLDLTLFLKNIFCGLSACPLKCYNCIPGPSGGCIETKIDCPSSYTHGSSLVSGGLEYKRIWRTCFPPDQCFNGSVNLGFSQAVINIMCCTSDLCNSQDVPDSSISSPNGKKCFQCDEKDCTKTLTCNGTEDYCISAAVNAGGGATTKVKGCASKMICSKPQTAQLSAVIGGEISCCQGDLCNSASSTTAHLLLFVTPLISLVFFS